MWTKEKKKKEQEQRDPRDFMSANASGSVSLRLFHPSIYLVLFLFLSELHRPSMHRLQKEKRKECVNWDVGQAAVLFPNFCS